MDTQGKKIGAVKEELKSTADEGLSVFIENYRADGRTGVQKLVEQAEKRLQKLEAEKKRIYELQSYEREYAYAAHICGIDEVGRGPLAGPVVAGAVILPKDCEILYINDSKKLSAAKREELYDVIMEQAVAVGIGQASPQRIDEINILQATYEAMREAINNLQVKPDILLNDAVTIPQVDIPQVPIIKGDAKSISRAPGIGKKTAERVVLDLRDKLELNAGTPEPGISAESGAGSMQAVSGAAEEAAEALTALGYARSEAMKAVHQAGGEEGMDSSDVQALLSGALRYLG